MALPLTTVFFGEGGKVGGIGGMARMHEFGMRKKGNVIAPGLIEEIRDSIGKSNEHVARILQLGCVCVCMQQWGGVGRLASCCKS